MPSVEFKSGNAKILVLVCAKFVSITIEASSLNEPLMLDCLRFVAKKIDSFPTNKLIVVFKCNFLSSLKDRSGKEVGDFLGKIVGAEYSVAIVVSRLNYGCFIEEVVTIAKLQGGVCELFFAEKNAIEWLVGEYSEILKYVIENSFYPLPLAEVSKVFGLTDSEVTKHIKEWTGKDFYAFRNHLRIVEAKRRLLDGETNMKKLSTELGFKHPDTFHRYFEKEVGVKAKLWRGKV